MKSFYVKAIHQGKLQSIAINIFIELLDENFLRKYNSPRKIATKSLNHLKTSTGSTFKEFKQSKKCCLFVKVGWF